MFAQVIQGRANDPGGLRKQFERWDQEVKPGAEGFLGSTAGVSDDGEFIAVARFESEEAARRNSDRPEQGQWWAETSKYLDGEATFHDCREVELFLGGGSDDAGFVQVIQGRAKDPNRLRTMNDEFNQRLPSLRPDLIGGLHADHGDGTFTDVNYFTSEQEARKGESQEYPEEIKAVFDEWMTLMDDVKYIDLREPWFSSK